MTTAEDGVPKTGAEVYPGEPQAELGKSLRSRHVSMIAIGGIIGAGLFVGSSTAIVNVGPAVLVSYLLAGALVLLVMRMLSEMAVALPGVQTFPDFARAGLGHWAGFLSGWLYWYFWVIVVPIEAIAGAKIVHEWLPTFPVWAIGAVLTAVLTAVNLLSTRSYGEFEFWFSSLKVAAILAFIVVAGSYALGFGAPAGPTFGNLFAHGGFAPNGAGPILAAVTTVIFSLVGAEIATIAAAESAEPNKVVARMTGSVAFRILIFYVLSVLLIVAVVPWNAIEPGKSPFASALTLIGIPGSATIMQVIVLIAVLSCLNSGLYVTSRVLFSLAAHGDAPQWLVSVNRAKVPVRAILVASSFSYVALAFSFDWGVSWFSPEEVFSFLVNATGALMLIVYMMIAAAQIRIRTRLEREAPELLTLKMWLFPWASWLAIAGMAAVLVAMAFRAGSRNELIASLLVTALFFGAYFILRRGKKAAGP